MAQESKLQKKVKNSLKRKGWLVVKIMLCSQNGWPDLQCLKSGKFILIEMKAKGEEPDPLQEYVHDLIRNHGGEVYTVDSWEDFLKLNLK